MSLLTGVLPELVTAEQRLRALAQKKGIFYKLHEEELSGGFVRSQADTSRYLKFRDDDYAVYVRNLKAKNPKAVPVEIHTWRPINAYGTSYHNFGAAFDVDMVKGTLEQLGALAPLAGLKWGGTFARKDAPHFQLPLTLLEAKARWLARGNAPGVARVATSAATTAAVVLLLVGGLGLLARAHGHAG
jgi:hypothetical protein